MKGFTAIRSDRIFDTILFIVFFISSVILSNVPVLAPLTTIYIYPILFIYVVIRFASKYLSYYIFNALLIILILIILSYLYNSPNVILFLRYIRAYIGVIIYSVIGSYFILMSSSRYIFWIAFMLILQTLGIFIHSYITDLTIGINIVGGSNEDRLSGEINANTYGYFIYYSIFSFGLLSILFKSKFWIVLYFGFLVVSLIILLLTASRAGFIMYFFAIISVFLAKRFKNYNRVTLSLLVLILLLLIISPYILTQIEGYTLFTRFRWLQETGEDTRLTLLYEAIRLSFENPLIGIGLGQFQFKYGNYTHNSFAELAVGSGYISMIIFLSIFIIFSKHAYQLSKVYDLRKKRIGFLIFTFGLTFFIYNFFYNMWMDPYCFFPFTFFYLLSTRFLKIEQVKQ